MRGCNASQEALYQRADVLLKEMQTHNVRIKRGKKTYERTHKMETYLNEVKSGTQRSGKADLLKHLSGTRLTQRQAIKAKCYDCDGYGDSGECELNHCSLFPYSPYAKNK